VNLSVNPHHPISLEFFPPRDLAAQERLTRSAKQLAALHPHYVSVTFGAGGTTRSGTEDTVRVLHRLGYPVAPHLSCVGASRQMLTDILHAYRDLGIKRIVALRGDVPSGMGHHHSELAHAVDLVRFIREQTGDWFHIEVAAYPEMHPESESATRDLDWFVEKVKAGADGAITQYFFNADAYFDFVDRVRTRGVTIPIVPGIMPITNQNQLIRFSEVCGAEVPRWIRLRLAEYGNDRAAIRAFGVQVIVRLCKALLAGGAPGLHFYTLNNADVTAMILKGLQS